MKDKGQNFFFFPLSSFIHLFFMLSLFSFSILLAFLD